MADSTRTRSEGGDSKNAATSLGSGRPNTVEGDTAVVSKAFRPRPLTQHAIESIDDVADELGGPYVPPPAADGAVAYTHFDGPSSEDNHLTILMAKEEMDDLPSQTLVRIKSLNDGGAVD